MKKLMAKAEKADGEERKKLMAEIKNLETDLRGSASAKRPVPTAAAGVETLRKKPRPGGPVLSGMSPLRPFRGHIYMSD